MQTQKHSCQIGMRFPLPPRGYHICLLQHDLAFSKEFCPTKENVESSVKVKLL